MNQSQSIARKPEQKTKKMILSFAFPFLAAMATWTIWDYCDISDGVDREREIGIKHAVTDKQLFLRSLKDSLQFAVPTGLIGLGCGFAVFGRSKKEDSSA